MGKAVCKRRPFATMTKYILYAPFYMWMRWYLFRFVIIIHCKKCYFVLEPMCKCLVWFEVFFYSFDDFFFYALMKYNHSFFPLFFCKIFVSCFFKKKRKVFLLLICKKKVSWMNWIVCWLSCRRICFFFLIPIFLNGIKKKIIVWKKFFMCLFSFIVNMDEKK